MNDKLGEILERKGHDVYEVDAGVSILEAVRQMVDANVGSLLVREAGEVIGIVTERDYIKRAALGGRVDSETAVREISSSPLIVGTLETTVDECLALMTDRRVRHVPIVDQGEVVGMVSIGDLVKFKSEQQSFELRYLTEYISAH